MAARRITSRRGGLLSPVTTLRVLHVGTAAILAAALTCLSPVSAMAVSSDTTTSSTDAGTEQPQDTGSAPADDSQPSEPADTPSEQASEEASQPADQPSEEASQPADEPSEEASEPAEEPSADKPGADAAVVRAGGTVRIRVTDNDADAKGATVTLPEQPADGTAAVVGDAVDFTPAAGVKGTTRFDYALAVGGAVRSTATVTVTVVPAPNGTLAIDDHASTPVNTGGHDGVLVFVLDNDVEAGQADVVVAGDPGHGTATALNTCGG